MLLQAWEKFEESSNARLRRQRGEKEMILKKLSKEFIDPNGKKIILNEEQGAAADAAYAFLKDRMGFFFCLSGYAGTGKSTMVLALLKAMRTFDVCVSAPTHKARAVIEATTGLGGVTVHSLLGLSPNVDALEFDHNSPKFEQRAQPTINNYSLVIMDECSMIGSDLFEAIKRVVATSRTKVLFLGDPAQLPPVKESISPIFTDKLVKHATLTKVMRQADSNPLMAIYSEIRDNLDTYEYKPDTITIDNGEGIEAVSSNDKAAIKDIIFGHIKDDPTCRVLCFTNKMVSGYNAAIRSKVKFPDSDRIVEVGEALMAYDNITNEANEYLLCNSSEYIVKSVRASKRKDITGFLIHLEDVFTGNPTSGPIFVMDHSDPDNIDKFNAEASKLIQIARNAKSSRRRGEMWGNYYDFIKKVVPMVNTGVVKKIIDYGYALTIHKSQGSTYTNVIVDHRDITKCRVTNTRNKLLYVALSRPRTKAFVIS